MLSISVVSSDATELTYLRQVVTNAEARFSNSSRPRKPEGSLGRTAQDGHLDSHTAPELCDTQHNTVFGCHKNNAREVSRTSVIF